MSLQSVKLVECPRDAMQGIHSFIPTDKKVAYLNQLLKVGFDTLDCGSFVSPKAIPQMQDTAEVLNRIDKSNSATKLLVIVANQRGATEAAAFSNIDYLGYPFSISETFQMRNTNATIEESLGRLQDIHGIATAANKELVVYLSMGFGNPYGDPWNAEICMKWVDKLSDLGIRILALSDTIGVATPDTISYLFTNVIPHYPGIEIGAHLHTQAHNWREKVTAAVEGGCLRFDSAIKGYGGCPMAKDDLTGNMPTENLVYYFQDIGFDTGLDHKEFIRSFALANEVFPADAR